MCVCVCVYHPILLQNSKHQTALLDPSSHNSSLQQGTPCVHGNQALATGPNSCRHKHVGVMSGNEAAITEDVYRRLNNLESVGGIFPNFLQ